MITLKFRTLRAVGFVLLTAITSRAAVLYVDVNSASPTPPYSSWATAAATIQDAVDASTDGDQLFVTNGVYQTGGRVVDGSLTNRVVVDKAVTVQSVNGPSVTEILGNPEKGDNAVRCVYLSDDSVLAGFTIASGATRESGDNSLEQSGGGIWCTSISAVATNCFLMNNVANLKGGGGYGGTFDGCTFSNNVSATALYWEASGGGAGNCTLNDCLLVTNSAPGGGAADTCQLNDCQLIQNNGLWAGGAENSLLFHCTITGCSAQSGAGAYTSTLSDCTLTHNYGQFGGGAEFCVMTNCILANNQTFDDESYGLGGGADQSILYNCLVYGNVSATSAGLSGSTVANCTVVSNITTQVGGAVDSCAVNNSIVIDNIGTDDSPNYSNSTFGYCDTVPMPDGSFGNFTDEPLFIDPDNGDFHPQSGSPTLNAGFNTFVTTAKDLDGNMRISGGTVDVGAYEFQPPIHYVNVNNASPASPYTSWDTAATNIQDAVDAADAGDNVVVTNGVYKNGGAVVQGSLTNRVAITKPLTMWSVNGAAVTLIEGNPEISDNAVRCVYLTNKTLFIGFTLTNGGTRAQNDEPFEEQSAGGLWGNSYDAVVQDCVFVNNNSALYGGGAYGGVLNDCTLVGNTSAFGGGAEFSQINNCTLSNNFALFFGSGTGGGANDSTLTVCVLMGNTADGSAGAAGSSTLTGCSILNNTASQGGGVMGGTLQGCVLSGNSAPSGGGAAIGNSKLSHCLITGNSSSYGGGVNGCALFNCVISNNFTFVQDDSGSYGGGAAYSGLTNCLVVGNTASLGGGAYTCDLEDCTVSANTADDSGGVNNSVLNNSIVYYNSAASNPDVSVSTMNYCCTPLPVSGDGNVTDEPDFADAVNGDYHLQDGSPCINAGNNNYVSAVNDLDDNTRIISTMVDIGAYEFQSPASSISYAWLLQYGLPIDGSADNADSDGDGLSNFQEWMANTDPIDPDSVFKILSVSTDENGANITWTSDPSRVYNLERSTELNADPFSVIAPDMGGQSGTNTSSYLDQAAGVHDKSFYRVSVRFGPPPPPPNS